MIRNKPRRKVFFLILIIIIGISALSELCVALNQITTEQNQVNTFFSEENIVQYQLSIPSTTGIHISAYLYIDKSDIDIKNHSVPIIIYIPGINCLKTEHFSKQFLLLKFGFAVLSIEQRGHGQSGGYFSFYQYEPKDVSSVIDYLQKYYLCFNTTHIGLVGMSLGGGTAVAAQALDSRIYASVIYHPFCNISDYIKTAGIDLRKIIGFTPTITYSGNLPLNPENLDKILNNVWYYRNTIEFINQTSTKNLLVLHGSEDTLIRPINSENLVKQADPLGNRTDIQFVLRPGLGHESNEKDWGSFEYQLAWFIHFYKNSSINLTNLTSEVNILAPQVNKYVQEFTAEYPNTGAYKINLAIFAILTCVDLYIVFYNLAGKSKDSQDSQDPQDSQDSQNSKAEKDFNGKNAKTLSAKNEKLKIYEIPLKVPIKDLMFRGILLIISYILAGIFYDYVNPSLIYSLFLVGPLIFTLLILLFHSSKYLKNFFKDLFKWSKIKSFIRGISIAIIPLFLYFTIYSYGGLNTRNETYPLAISTNILYIFVIIINLLVPVLFSNNLNKRSTILFVPFMFVSLLIFAGLVSFGEIFLFMNIGEQIGVLFLISVVLLLVYLFLKIMSKYLVKNMLSTIGIISLLLSAFLLLRFLRIF